MSTSQAREDAGRVKYKTILADPPWMESGGGRICRGAQRHYTLMKTDDIIALRVAELADTDAHLYLWTTNNFLRDALRVMEAWGFRYVTIITWAKPTIGLGQYFRGQTEHCLFGVRGALPYKLLGGRRVQGTTLISAPKREHSAKPEEMRHMIERVSYPPRVELFARQISHGWDVWGNEVSSDVVLASQQMVFPEPGASEEQARILKGREAFVARYAAGKGWDRDGLTFEQILEIRQQEGWKKP